MIFIRKIILLIIIMLSHVAKADLSDSSRFDWMNSSILSFSPPCLEIPEFSGLNQTSKSLNLDQSGQWVPVGTEVQEGKLLQIKWSTEGVFKRPAKYRVMYRIDPRFQRPQLFIQTYDYSQNKYVSDFHHYKNGVLVSYQNVPEMTFSQRVKDYDDYFNFVNRNKIQVKKDDVVNVTIDDTGSFFGSTSEMNTELGSLDDISIVYTESALQNNRILYANAAKFCQYGITPTRPEYVINCLLSPLLSGEQNFWDVGSNNKTIEGRIYNAAFELSKSNLSSCPNSANGNDNDPMCYYDKGRGVEILVGGTVVKNITTKFVTSPFSGKSFFYHKSDTDGDLDFNTSWLIDGMYEYSSTIANSQFMKDWALFPDYLNFLQFVANNNSSYLMNFLHFGRYLFEVEVGNSVSAISMNDLNTIEVEYTITDSGSSVPSASTSGSSIERDFRSNASSSGFLWMRVMNPEGKLSGVVNAKIANYTGSTWFSDLVYGKLIEPLRTKFNELTLIIYSKLITNASFQGIARTMLVLYIIIYGLVFLAGAVQITVSDIVTRVIKIAVVVALFSEASWTFFNQNLFNVFTSGIDSLMTQVIGISSKADNPFGFVDPIFDKYTNGRVWGLLFIQLLQIHNGLTFFAIMTIYGILLYFKAVLEVVVGYCLAFLGLAVMVSIAPFFIVLILFERTKSIFDNWISIMFSYMIQPTMMLIFLLLIDQIMSDHVARTVVRACWDILIPIKIGLDLNHIGIPLSFSFELPFLPGIPFYVPQLVSISSISDFFGANGTIMKVATSTFLFYALCKLAAGVVDYVSLVVQYLTNVLAARQEGKLQQSENPIKDIIGDMDKVTKPITSIPSKLGKFAKEKLIDQKISHRHGPEDKGDADYSKFKPDRDSDDMVATVSKQDKGSSAVTEGTTESSQRESSKFRFGKGKGKTDSRTTSGNITLGANDDRAVRSDIQAPSDSGGKTKVDIAKTVPDKQSKIDLNKQGPGEALREHVEGKHLDQGKLSEPTREDQESSQRRDSVGEAEGMRPREEVVQEEQRREERPVDGGEQREREQVEEQRREERPDVDRNAPRAKEQAEEQRPESREESRERSDAVTDDRGQKTERRTSGKLTGDK